MERKNWDWEERRREGRKGVGEGRRGLSRRGKGEGEEGGEGKGGEEGGKENVGGSGLTLNGSTSVILRNFWRLEGR